MLHVTASTGINVLSLSVSVLVIPSGMVMHLSGDPRLDHVAVLSATVRMLKGGWVFRAKCNHPEHRCDVLLHLRQYKAKIQRESPPPAWCDC